MPRQIQITGLPDTPALSADIPNLAPAMSEPEPAALGYATVGHEDENPAFARIEGSQVYIEITLRPEGEEIVARLGAPGAGPDQGWYAPLSIGCQVIVMLVDGDPADAVIIGRLWDRKCAIPTSVAGVQTGAAAATEPEVSVGAPCWHFLKTASGQMLGIETGANGDIVIHSAASVEIKSSDAGAIHLNGSVALGVGPTTPPTGCTVGPGNSEIAGVPMVKAIRLPKTPTVPLPPANIVPYPATGFADGIIRAKDLTESHAGVDPAFWLFISALFAHPLIGPVLIAAGVAIPPVVMNAEHRLPIGGSPSNHTASD